MEARTSTSWPHAILCSACLIPLSLSSALPPCTSAVAIDLQTHIKLTYALELSRWPAAERGMYLCTAISRGKCEIIRRRRRKGENGLAHQRGSRVCTMRGILAQSLREITRTLSIIRGATISFCNWLSVRKLDERKRERKGKNISNFVVPDAVRYCVRIWITLPSHSGFHNCNLYRRYGYTCGS